MSNVNFDFGVSVEVDVNLFGGLVFELSDGEYLLIVKVVFVYLCWVLLCGIEGYVIVEFIVIK